MLQITDTNGNPLTSVSFALPENTTSQTVVAVIPARANYFLSAINTANLTVKARKTGSGNPFVDIDSNPIDLTSEAPNSVSYDFQVVAASVSQNVSDSVRVLVTANP